MRKIIKTLFIMIFVFGGFVYLNDNKILASSGYREPDPIPITEIEDPSFNKNIKDTDMNINFEDTYDFEFSDNTLNTEFIRFYENGKIARTITFEKYDSPDGNNSNLHFLYTFDKKYTKLNYADVYQFRLEDDGYKLSNVNVWKVKDIYFGEASYEIDREKYKDDQYLYFMFTFYKNVNSKTIDSYVLYKTYNPYYYRKPILNMEIEPSSTTIFKGGSVQLTPKFTPSYTSYDKTVTWTSSNEEVATVDENGVVNGVGYGDVLITGKSVHGFIDTVNVKVNVPVESIEIIPELTVNRSDNAYISVKVTPEEAINDIVLEWSVDNEVIYLSSGRNNLEKRIIQSDGGKATITVKTQNGLKATCKVTSIYPLEDIYISNLSRKVKLGNELQLEYITYPSHPTEGNILTFESKNENILTVDNNGLIKTKGVGNTYVVAKVNGKRVYSVDIVVYDDIYRIYGDTRYETAFKVADYMKEVLNVERFETVVIATGNDYPDALTGSYLAIHNNAPILMTNEKRIDEVVSYIENNVVDGGKVYILGGEKALPKTLESKLTNYEVKRLAGANRYETNLLILNEVGVTTEDLLICTGNNYADSLSASATGKPILLVNNVKSELSEEQIEFISSLNNNKVYIIGGYGAVNDNLERQISRYTRNERIYGEDRFRTSANILNKFYSECDRAVIVYGYNFPDGLAGGPLAYFTNSSLLLGNDYDRYITQNALDMNDVYSGFVLGGPTLISDDSIEYFFELKEDANIIKY